MHRRAPLAAAAAIGAALTLTFPAAAEVPSSVRNDLKKALADLYGEIDPADTIGREQAFVDMDQVLAKKDKKGDALRTPAFWVDTIHEVRFQGKLAKSATHKKITTENFSTVTANGKAAQSAMTFWGPALYNKSNAYPLLISVLPKGADAKAYLEGTLLADEEMQKGWVFAVVPISDTFDPGQSPVQVVDALVAISSKFNVDNNRRFLEGVGDAASAVHKAALETLSPRIAGVVLRCPSKISAGVNAKLYDTLVVTGKGDEAASAAVAGLKEAVGEKVGTVECADAAACQGPVPEVAAWLKSHAPRATPSSYTFTTTFTQDQKQGEPFTGTMLIRNPAKWDEPTTVTVKYDKATNTVDLEAENLGEFEVYMNDDLLDLDKPVRIVVNGKELANRTFERRVREIFRIADGYGEWGRVFPASYFGYAPAKSVAADADGNK